MCDYLKKALTELSIPFEEDDTASKINGNCGNLYAYVEGEKALPPILLSAHMDSVEPAKKKSCIFHPDGTITSDGTTVLGADDLAGICAILEAITSIKEDGIAHRPVEIVIDVSEETYCEGIQQFDFSRLKSKEAYVFDLTGPIGGAAYQRFFLSKPFSTEGLPMLPFLLKTESMPSKLLHMPLMRSPVAGSETRP